MGLSSIWVVIGFSSVGIELSWLRQVEVGELHPHLDFSSCSVPYLLQDLGTLALGEGFWLDSDFRVRITPKLALTGLLNGG